MNSEKHKRFTPRQYGTHKPLHMKNSVSKSHSLILNKPKRIQSALLPPSQSNSYHTNITSTIRAKFVTARPPEMNHNFKKNFYVNNFFPRSRVCILALSSRSVESRNCERIHYLSSNSIICRQQPFSLTDGCSWVQVILSFEARGDNCWMTTQANF